MWTPKGSHDRVDAGYRTTGERSRRGTSLRLVEWPLISPESGNLSRLGWLRLAPTTS